MSYPFGAARLAWPLACLLFALGAQSFTSLRGVVSDATGASVPGAIIAINSPSTGFQRKVLADESGAYQFLQISPGIYDVKAEKPGFATVVRNSVELLVNTPFTLNLHMEVGSVNDTVRVEAEVPPLNTVDASIGNAFNQTQVRQLPLLTRNVVELLSLQPGVSPTGEVLGAKRDQNNITLDGVDVNDNQNSGIPVVSTNSLSNGSNANGVPGEAGFNAALPVPLDSVQEFRVTVGGQGASLGRSAGGQVTLVTKSGGNQFHGSLYEFHRNTVTAANNWFSNRAGIDREALIRNQYGASLGGRIIRDRAFFFANWESRRDASAQAVSRIVPSESLRQGIVRFRTSDGAVQTLSAAETRALDPLGLGMNDAIKARLNAYPVGNDDSLGADRGLNFTGLRFNAPFKQDDKAYVAKMDFKLDRESRHNLSIRGSLADNARDTFVAQFPGQDAAAKVLNNSKGMSAVYTAVIKPSLINTFTFGYTRLGLQQAGTMGDRFSFDTIDTLLNYGNDARSYTRILPTTNFVNDLMWTKGTHTIGAGVNFRFLTNDRSNFINSFAQYSFSRNTLRGLGGDIIPVVQNYVRQRSGNNTLTLSDSANMARGYGNLLGLVNQYSATYNFGRDGSAIPLGQAVSRRFATNEYEFFLQDAWRVRPDLTITYGVRYSNNSVPYETNGVQVGTTVGVDRYFAERVGASMAGVPGSAMPNALLSYDLVGPENGRAGWYKRDKNNWAPRFSIAYAPTNSKLLGAGSVLRAGAAMVYDRFGSDLVTEFDRTGSPGLATQVTQPANTDFTTSSRFNGAYPALPVAPQGKFPFTPPAITGGFNSGVGISPDLVAPYSMLLNASYARNLPGKLTIEVGYAGRLSRKGLLQQDMFQPLTRFKDPQSGQTWAEASGVLRALVDRGVTPAQVAANPGIAGQVPFFENMFPGLRNLYIPGSATANYFDAAYNQNAGSELDALNQMDRERSPEFPNCISRLGCNTFFAMQNAGLRSWVNAGQASFHGGTLAIRRALTSGFSFDFNYTLSHSIDNSSATESGAGNGGAVIQDSFDVNSFRGSSDFDIRHNINANGLYELPFGKGKHWLNNAPGWTQQLAGGWQISALMRYRTGLPTTINNGGIYPTNYLNSAIAIAKPGVPAPAVGVGYNQNGVPSMYANTNAVNSYIGQYPGLSGTRSIVRLAPMTNFDIAVAKAFLLPFEGHRLQFRAEAFNAFNNVNFYDASLRLDRPATFGDFQRAMPPRVMQFALRYEF